MNLKASQESTAVNWPAFNSAKDALGEKFDIALGYYMEDTEKYLSNIILSLEKKSYEQAARAAHTIKSSSRQFGFFSLSELAEQTESLARSGDNAASHHSEIENLYWAMDDIFASVKAGINWIS